MWWFGPPRNTHFRRAPSRPRARLTEFEQLEDRTTPVNLQLTGAFLVDASDVAEPNPVYGQMMYIQANWSSLGFSGGEPAVYVRYTANYPANYFYSGSPVTSYPADSGTLSMGTGSSSWYWWRGGWWAGTASFTITVTVDPDNQI